MQSRSACAHHFLHKFDRANRARVSAHPKHASARGIALPFVKLDQSWPAKHPTTIGNRRLPAQSLATAFGLRLLQKEDCVIPALTVNHGVASPILLKARSSHRSRGCLISPPAVNSQMQVRLHAWHARIAVKIDGVLLIIRNHSAADHATPFDRPPAPARAAFASPRESSERYAGPRDSAASQRRSHWHPLMVLQKHYLIAHVPRAPPKESREVNKPRPDWLYAPLDQASLALSTR